MGVKQCFQHSLKNVKFLAWVLCRWVSTNNSSSDNFRYQKQKKTIPISSLQHESEVCSFVNHSSEQTIWTSVIVLSCRSIQKVHEWMHFKISWWILDMHFSFIFYSCILHICFWFLKIIYLRTFTSREYSWWLRARVERKVSFCNRPSGTETDVKRLF